MKEDTVSRREAITKGAALVAGVGAAAILPEQAQAADGDQLVAGEVKIATLETGVKLADDSLKGVFLANDVHPDPSVVQRAGVFGSTNQPGDMSAGVLGRADNENASGVLGVNFWGGNGVHGYTRSGNGSGVTGISEGGGPGVLGIGGDIGVQANSEDGRALDVKGKAYFSTAGRGVISKGKATGTVSGVALDADALIIVTLQASPGIGVFVHYTEKTSDTSFTVVLNRVAVRDTPFAWFVIN